MDRLESRHYLWCSTESCREHSLSRAPAAGSAEKDAAIILSVRLKGQDLQEMTLRTSQKSHARISALSKKSNAEFLHRALGFRQKPSIKSCPECEVLCRGKAGGDCLNLRSSCSSALTGSAALVTEKELPGLTRTNPGAPSQLQPLLQLKGTTSRSVAT